MLRALFVGCLAVLSVSMLASCGDSEGPTDPRDRGNERVVRAARLSGRGSTATQAKRSVPSPPPIPEFPPPPYGPPHGADILVVDEYGEPIEGAEVVHRSKTHRTDANGRTAIGSIGGHGMPSDFIRAKTILVRVPGYVPVEHLCAEGGGDQERVQVRERGLPLMGRCVDTRGRALANVTLHLEYRDMPRFVLATDAQGTFSTSDAPRQEGTLCMATRGWTSRPLRVVPPARDLRIVAYREARIHGRFDVTYAKNGWHAAHVYLETNQGWEERVDPKNPFTIPCCPGEVVVSWQRGILGRFLLEEGQTLSGVVFPIDTTSRREDPGSRPVRSSPGWLDLDLSGVRGGDIEFVAFFADRPPQNLRRISVGEVVRVSLRSKEARWLGVEPDARAWRQPVRNGQVVRIQRPALGTFALRLVDRGGEPVSHGWIAVRWPGTRHVANAASWHCAEPVPDSAKALPGSGAFHSRELGPGLYDLAWKGGYYADFQLLARGVEMPDPVGSIDLGCITLPEPKAIHVRVEDARGQRVPGAIVRLRQGRDVAAVRTGADGEVRIPVLDPTDLVLEAEAEGLGRGELRIPNDATREVVTIRLAE